ncbi:MAG TPA: hypothetical protein VK207_09395 [Bacteroidales bacterium]|nr:hypothetical protein [Bacteroidales bacterium]
MKTIIFFVFSLFLIPVAATAQKNPEYKSNEKELRDLFEKYNSQDTLFRLVPELKIPSIPELFNKKYALKVPDEYSTLTQQYPGASRYYAKSKVAGDTFHEKSFVKEPDTTAKYYLIIKDPLRNTVTK